MVTMTALDKRLGLKLVLEDHVETWSTRSGAGRREDHRAWALWFFLTPTLLAAPFLFFHLNLKGVGQILAGVAVFTGLLFGLLGLIFNVGVTLRKDAASFKSAHDLPRTVSDMRANVTYAIVVAIVLDLVLVVGASLTDPASGLGWGWTPVIVWMFTHLGLTLLMVLRRFRTAFNYVTR